MYNAIKIKHNGHKFSVVDDHDGEMYIGEAAIDGNIESGIIDDNGVWQPVMPFHKSIGVRNVQIREGITLKHIAIPQNFGLLLIALVQDFDDSIKIVTPVYMEGYDDLKLYHLYYCKSQA